MLGTWGRKQEGREGNPVPPGVPGGLSGDPAAAGGAGTRWSRARSGSEWFCSYRACLPWHSRLEHCAGFHQSPLWQWQMLQSSTFTSMPAGMMVVPAKQLGPVGTQAHRRNEYTFLIILILIFNLMKLVYLPFLLRIHLVPLYPKVWLQDREDKHCCCHLVIPR